QTPPASDPPKPSRAAPHQRVRVYEHQKTQPTALPLKKENSNGNNLASFPPPPPRPRAIDAEAPPVPLRSAPTRPHGLHAHLRESPPPSSPCSLRSAPAVRFVSVRFARARVRAEV
uniref:Uncharacterized protein n=1 Tax=Triticum urartu TaxID=4572 RepID=A0A8R7UNG2_TRIUA